MSNILRLEKTLSERPAPSEVPDVTIRPFNTDADVATWLRLRETAFAGLTARGRAWTPADFAREFLAQPWWSDDRLWFAEAPAAESTRGETTAVGAVALGRGAATVHWLMVVPQFRRRGIGRLLLGVLERSAWDRGRRRITLETHASWGDAARLYANLGYEPARGTISI